jgi:hypothetical protein
MLITLGKIATETSVLAARDAVEQFMAAHGPHSGIADLSGVEKVYVKADFVWFLAAKPSAIPHGMSLVVVAPRLDVYGLSRMFQTLRDNRGIHQVVVRTLKEAFELLGLETPHFKPVDFAGPGKIAA